MAALPVQPHLHHKLMQRSVQSRIVHCLQAYFSRLTSRFCMLVHLLLAFTHKLMSSHCMQDQQGHQLPQVKAAQETS